MSRCVNCWIDSEGYSDMDEWTCVRYRYLDMIKDVSEWKKNRLEGWVGHTESCRQLDRVLNGSSNSTFFG